MFSLSIILPTSCTFFSPPPPPLLILSGMFSFFKNLTGGKTITREAMEPALDKLKEHLVTKNVAHEIAEKLCGSVATKLDGKVVGSFTG
jgi:signal recognition particle receptor subunit alpha